MKKILLLSVFCLTGFIYQANAQAGLRVGIKGGLNFANVDTDISADSRTGFHAGAFATIKIAKFAIQPELVYSSQGSELRFEGFEKTKSNFNYLNVPVLLKLYLIGGLNLQIGPQFGFLLGANSEDDIAEQAINEISNSEDISDLKDAFNGSDVSLGLGAGIDLPFGLTADARYNLGLSEIDDSEALGATRNQVFQISLGYRLINLGK